MLSHFRSELLEMGTVMSAALWRLLPDWAGKGPVLEVLFLATNPNMRERQWAVELERDLCWRCSSWQPIQTCESASGLWNSRETCAGGALLGNQSKHARAPVG